LVWVDSGSEQTSRTKDHSDVEIRIIRDLVQQAIAVRAGLELDQPRHPFVGIIAFYSEQVRLIQEAMAAMPETKGLVEIGTVDSFQGKEFPLTILSCCRHDPVGGNVGFLCLPNRVNVALSRAERQLVIVGSAPTMLHPESGRGSPPLKDFCEAAGENLFRAKGNSL
jgi:superfamily I DNA and/or RNA helicase